MRGTRRVNKRAIRSKRTMRHRRCLDDASPARASHARRARSGLRRVDGRVSVPEDGDETATTHAPAPLGELGRAAVEAEHEPPGRRHRDEVELLACVTKLGRRRSGVQLQHDVRTRAGAQGAGSRVRGERPRRKPPSHLRPREYRRVASAARWRRAARAAARPPRARSRSTGACSAHTQRWCWWSSERRRAMWSLNRRGRSVR